MWCENIIKENIKGSNDQFSIKVGVHGYQWYLKSIGQKTGTFFYVCNRK